MYTFVFTYLIFTKPSENKKNVTKPSLLWYIPNNAHCLYAKKISYEHCAVIFPYSY